MPPKYVGYMCTYTQIDARGVWYEIGEILGEICEWKIVENWKKAAVRGKNGLIQCRRNLADMGASTLKLILGEAATK